MSSKNWLPNITKLGHNKIKRFKGQKIASASFAIPRPASLAWRSGCGRCQKRTGTCLIRRLPDILKAWPRQQVRPLFFRGLFRPGTQVGAASGGGVGGVQETPQGLGHLDSDAWKTLH